MEWIKIEKELPEFYECVIVELSTGEEVEVWRATDGEFNIWTKFGTNDTFFDNDIVKWKRHKLENKSH